MVGAQSAANAHAMQTPIRMIAAALLLNLRKELDAFYHDARPRGTLFP